MKINLFKYFSLLVCCFGLNGCGYLISFGQLMFDDTCSNWNCTHNDDIKIDTTFDPRLGPDCRRTVGQWMEWKEKHRLSDHDYEKITELVVDGCRKNKSYTLKEDPKLDPKFKQAIDSLE